MLLNSKCLPPDFPATPCRLRQSLQTEIGTPSGRGNRDRFRTPGPSGTGFSSNLLNAPVALRDDKMTRARAPGFLRIRWAALAEATSGAIPNLVCDLFAIV
jgi:hypothetical protein